MHKFLFYKYLAKKIENDQKLYSVGARGQTTNPGPDAGEFSDFHLFLNFWFGGIFRVGENSGSLGEGRVPQSLAVDHTYRT